VPEILLIALIATALLFDFFNGMNDAANSIATIVSTRVLSPRWAVFWAAFFNFVAFLVFGQHVAKTMGTGIVLPNVITDQVIFGALVGAIPPAMGWAAGGGRLSDPSLAALAFFFFMWQVPHFCLHLLSYGKEQAEAGLPSLTDVLRTDQLERLAFQWVSAAAVSALLLGQSGLLQSPLAKAGLLAAALWLVSGGVFLVLRHEANHALLFRRTNTFMLAVMLLTIVDRCPGCLFRMMSAS